MKNKQALVGESKFINQKVIDVNALLSVRREKNNSTELLKKNNKMIVPLEEDKCSTDKMDCTVSKDKFNIDENIQEVTQELQTKSVLSLENTKSVTSAIEASRSKNNNSRIIKIVQKPISTKEYLSMQEGAIESPYIEEVGLTESRLRQSRLERLKDVRREKKNQDIKQIMKV